MNILEYTLYKKIDKDVAYCTTYVHMYADTLREWWTMHSCLCALMKLGKHVICLWACAHPCSGSAKSLALVCIGAPSRTHQQTERNSTLENWRATYLKLN